MTAGRRRAAFPQAELLDLQFDAIADDVEIDFEKMRRWTAEQATAYFESGGASAGRRSSNVLGNVDLTTAGALPSQVPWSPTPGLPPHLRSW